MEIGSAEIAESRVNRISCTLEGLFSSRRLVVTFAATIVLQPCAYVRCQLRGFSETR